MKRREFMVGLSSAAAWPLAARAQQDERVKRVAMLMYGAENDPNTQANAAAIRDGLLKLGWIEGRNLRTELRFIGADPDAIRDDVEEVVGLAPEVIVAHTGPITRAVQLRTRTIPLVFVGVGDPVANGFVESLSRPEGNTTGITNLFFSIAGKWVELLKAAVPRLGRVGFIYHAVFNMAGYWGSIEAAAQPLAVQPVRIPVDGASDIERAIDAFAVEPNSGLIVAAQPNVTDRNLIFRLATLHRLPTCCFDRIDFFEGGLMSYGPNNNDLFRRASYLVDRILRGTKVSELPVEFPTKFELVINLKTAKALGSGLREGRFGSILLKKSRNAFWQFLRKKRS